MLFILTLTLLVPLIFIGFFQDYEQYNDIVLIIPNSNYTVDVPIEKIEKVNEEKFLTTYLVEQEKKIRAIHEHHLVSIKGTNYAYPFVLNYNIVNGGFFPKSSQVQESKVAVLNENAAFNIFGGNDCIGNEIIIDRFIYRVIGVINDKDKKNKNIYIPITLLNQSPKVFVALLDRDISEGYIKAQYKNLGITTDYYDFINLNSLTLMIKEKAIASCAFMLIILLLLQIKWVIHRLTNQYMIFRRLLIKNYLRELFRKEAKIFGVLIGHFGLIVALIYFIVLLVMYTFEMFLKWKDLSAFFIINCSGSHSMNIFTSIEKSLIYSNILFILLLILFFTLIYSFILYKDQ